MVKKFTTFFFFLFAVLISAQELPPIQNYTPIDYGGENQNWSISQSKNRLIYIANNDGLLEYNGAAWTLYPSPNETIMRSVKVIDDRIYTGSYMEFGFWEKNEVGVLEYTSISQKLRTKLIEDEEFWNIIGVEDGVVFQSLNRIYIYDVNDESISSIDSDEEIVRMFELNGSVYFQRTSKGIYKIENGNDVPFLENDMLKGKEIINLFLIDTELLILTRNNGFLTFKDDVLREWGNSINDKLKTYSIYDAIQLKNGDLVFGTIANGLIYLKNTDTFLYEINQSNGLINNTILSVYEDMDSNLWLGLDNGISYINIDSPFRIYKDQNGVLGSVYTSASLKGNLYLGTNQGLFYKSINGKEGFKFIKGTEGQVWSLNLINGELFCGHHTGTFIIIDEFAKKIANIQGTWKVDKLNGNDNLLIQGNYDGLYMLEKKKDIGWQLRNRIKGFNNSSRQFEVFGNEVFVNHEYKGVFKLTVNNTYTETENIVIDTILKGANSGISKYNGELIYAYKKGIFKYDKNEESFKKDSLLSTVYNEQDYISGKINHDDEKQEFWIFTKSNITNISKGKLVNKPSFKWIPLTHKERNDVIEYENILYVDELNDYFVGTNSGYITIKEKEISIADFGIDITKIKNGTNQDHSVGKDLVDREKKQEFKNNENNFEISYHTAKYTKYLKPRYQFQLLGIYDEWSEWSNESTVFFENLPHGEYTFNVRSKVGAKLSTNIASYNFRIDKPWYITNLMLAIYGLGVLLFSLFMHTLYRRYYHKKQDKLIEKNKRDLELAKVQSEKELIKIKNEQLQKDIQSKSQELAASTLSIVKKNELLTAIKNQLVGSINDKGAIQPVLNTIDKSLDHHDNWKLFKEAFNNVDRKFLKKLKKTHPNLSPNDIKLCAYLRLNLSSKEIAPLFNISSRSVEIKRYRLRKKMNLPHEENLVNYILQL